MVELKKIAARPTSWLCGLAVLLLLLSVEDYKYTGTSLGKVAKQAIAEQFVDSLYSKFFSSFSFVREKNSGYYWFTDSQLANMIPLYGFSQKQRSKEWLEDVESLEEIVLAEAKEEPVEQDELDLEALLLEENSAAVEGQSGESVDVVDTGNGATVPDLVESEVVSDVFTPHEL